MGDQPTEALKSFATRLDEALWNVGNQLALKGMSASRASSESKGFTLLLAPDNLSAIQFEPMLAAKGDLQLRQDNCSVVARFIEETINQGQIESAAQFVWEDVVEQVPFPGQGPGLEGLKDVLRGMRNAFPDLYFSVEEQISQDDKVLTRFEWSGTHRNDFLGVPATGRSVKVWGMVIDRLQDGKIKETRIIMDIFGLMMQLDAFTPKSPSQ